MIRTIVLIDEEKCIGCGKCAAACHENAIAMIDGKAKLIRDDYCDGLGNCLPVCPADAISFEEREAAEYDEKAVLENQARIKAEAQKAKEAQDPRTSCLTNWPVQVKLAAVNNPCFRGCDLLIAADCTAYAYNGIHEDFIAGRTTLIACPKLDGVDYSEKFMEIFKLNDIKSITLLRMQVPCCGGLVMMVKNAIALSGKDIPLNVVTIGNNGEIIEGK